MRLTAAAATASRTARIQFANGTSEIDLKGKDVQQQSFWAWPFTVSTRQHTTRSTSVVQLQTEDQPGASAPFNTLISRASSEKLRAEHPWSTRRL